MNDKYTAEDEIAWLSKALEDCLRIAGCECIKPLLGFRQHVGPRCRLCNTVAYIKPRKADG